MAISMKVALISPKYESNVALVCRALAFFGLEEIYLVKPRIKLEKVIPISRSGKHVAEKIKVVDDLNEIEGFKLGAISELDAEKHGIKIKYTVFDKEFKEKARKGVLVFGAEDFGLKDYFEKIDEFFTIPTPFVKFSVLNLSQAVLITLWEIFRERLVLLKDEE